MKRLFDFALALVALSLLALPILIVALAVRMTSPGPVLYWSDRVGRNNLVFKMPKFRSMRIDTPAVATHLLQDPAKWLTPIGSFLRRSSLDELPQLWSILKGDMSLVGPRPALFNQEDLITFVWASLSRFPARPCGRLRHPLPLHCLSSLSRGCTVPFFGIADGLRCWLLPGQ